MGLGQNTKYSIIFENKREPIAVVFDTLIWISQLFEEENSSIEERKQLGELKEEID